MATAGIILKFTSYAENIKGRVQIIPEVMCLHNFERTDQEQEHTLVEYKIPITYKIKVKKMPNTKDKINDIDKIYHSCVDLMATSSLTNLYLGCGDTSKIISDTHIHSPLIANLTTTNLPSHNLLAPFATDSLVIKKTGGLNFNDCAVSKLSLRDVTFIEESREYINIKDEDELKKGQMSENTKYTVLSYNANLIDKIVNTDNLPINYATVSTQSAETEESVTKNIDNNKVMECLRFSPICSINTEDNVQKLDNLAFDTAINTILHMQHEKDIKREFDFANIEYLYREKFSRIYSIKCMEESDIAYETISPKSKTRDSPVVRVAKFIKAMEKEITPLKSMLDEIIRKCSLLGLTVNKTLSFQSKCSKHKIFQMQNEETNRIKNLQVLKSNRVVYSMFTAMSSKEVVQDIVNNLSFEVEAIPQNFINGNGSSKNTPINIKIRVKNKNDTLQEEVITIPKYGNTHNISQQVRLIRSDQTILSFDVYVEPKDAKTGKKHKKNFLNILKPGLCLSNIKDDDDTYQYLPSTPATTNELNIESQSDSVLRRNFILKKGKLVNVDGGSTLPNRDTYFLGKCKPGGCLDPPFGEEIYTYKLSSKNNSPLKHNGIEEDSLKMEETRSNKDNSAIEPSYLKNSDNQMIQSLSLSKHDKISSKPNSILELQSKDSMRLSIVSKDSNSIITYPPTEAARDNPQDSKNIKRKTLSEDMSNKLVNEFTEIFFKPRQEILKLDNKEIEINRQTNEKSTDSSFNKKYHIDILKNKHLIGDLNHSPNRIVNNLNDIMTTPKKTDKDVFNESKTKILIQSGNSTNSSITKITNTPINDENTISNYISNETITTVDEDNIQTADTGNISFIQDSEEKPLKLQNIHSIAESLNLKYSNDERDDNQVNIVRLNINLLNQNIPLHSNRSESKGEYEDIKQESPLKYYKENKDNHNEISLHTVTSNFNVLRNGATNKHNLDNALFSSMEIKESHSITHKNNMPINVQSKSSYQNMSCGISIEGQNNNQCENFESNMMESSNELNERFLRKGSIISHEVNYDTSYDNKIFESLSKRASIQNLSSDNHLEQSDSIKQNESNTYSTLKNNINIMSFETKSDNYKTESSNADKISNDIFHFATDNIKTLREESYFYSKEVETNDEANLITANVKNELINVNIDDQSEVIDNKNDSTKFSNHVDDNINRDLILSVIDNKESSLHALENMDNLPEYGNESGEMASLNKNVTITDYNVDIQKQHTKTFDENTTGVNENDMCIQKQTDTSNSAFGRSYEKTKDSQEQLKYTSPSNKKSDEMIDKNSQSIDQIASENSSMIVRNDDKASTIDYKASENDNLKMNQSSMGTRRTSDIIKISDMKTVNDNSISEITSTVSEIVSNPITEKNIYKEVDAKRMNKDEVVSRETETASHSSEHISVNMDIDNNNDNIESLSTKFNNESLPIENFEYKHDISNHKDYNNSNNSDLVDSIKSIVISDNAGKYNTKIEKERGKADFDAGNEIVFNRITKDPSQHSITDEFVNNRTYTDYSPRKLSLPADTLLNFASEKQGILEKLPDDKSQKEAYISWPMDNTLTSNGEDNVFEVVKQDTYNFNNEGADVPNHITVTNIAKRNQSEETNQNIEKIIKSYTQSQVVDHKMQNPSSFSCNDETINNNSNSPSQNSKSHLKSNNKRFNKNNSLNDTIKLAEQEVCHLKSISDKDKIKSYTKRYSVLASIAPTTGVKNTKNQIYINLGFQSYVNDNNERVFRTIDGDKETERYENDKVTIVRSLLRLPYREIKIPVDEAYDISLKLTKTNDLIEPDSRNIQKTEVADNTTRDKQYLTGNKERYNNIDNNNLIAIYETELVPLRKVIRDLKDDIDLLVGQQLKFREILQRAVKYKPNRVINSKRCGCSND